MITAVLRQWINKFIFASTDEIRVPPNGFTAVMNLKEFQTLGGRPRSVAANQMTRRGPPPVMFIVTFIPAPQPHSYYK